MKWIASAALVGLLSLTVPSPEWSTPRAFSTILAGVAVPATAVTPSADHRQPEVAWRLDFSEYTEGPIEAWLEAKGFRLEHGAEDPELLALSIHEGALVQLVMIRYPNITLPARGLRPSPWPPTSSTS